MDKFLLLFESNGKKYTAGDNILSIDGFSASDYDIKISNHALYDGGSVLGARISPRSLQIQIEEKWANKNNYLSFFNPKNDGVLYVTVGVVQRLINYRVEKFKVTQKNISYPPVLTIDLICPDPYFYDVEDYGKNIAGKQALFAFPFIWLSTKDIVTDYKVFTDETLIVNKGDVQTGLVINFTCTSAVTNPRIELVNTGEYMRILRTMIAGDTVQFETNTARKNIFVNGQKYTNFDPASTFFNLKEGENILKYGSDSGYESLDVYVYYRAKYLGVI